MDLAYFAGAAGALIAGIALRRKAVVAHEDAVVEFAKGVPKAELHLHIEGTLEPELMFALAKKHGVDPGFPTIEAAKKARDFGDLQEFLDMYYAGCNVLRTREDFREMATAYFERAKADNVKYCEVFFDPQTHTERGIPFETVILGLHDAVQDAESRLGVSCRLIMCILRHLSAASAMATLDQATPFKDKILALGLDSGEKGNPPSKFAEVYKRAADELDWHLVAHAGEEGPAAYIEDAVNKLQVRRIDHGVRCLEDDAVVEHLAKEGIPLTVCPLSNYKLQVYSRYFGGKNIVGTLMKRGLVVTLNSDDPAYFGGYVSDNYVRTVRDCSLDSADVTKLATNSFEAAFLPPSAKAAYVAQVEEYAAKHAP